MFDPTRLRETISSLPKSRRSPHSCGGRKPADVRLAETHPMPTERGLSLIVEGLIGKRTESTARTMVADPAHNAQPGHDVDPDREDIQHFGFDSGFHDGMGAPFARIGAEISLLDHCRYLTGSAA